jgi:hypothetical protein
MDFDATGSGKLIASPSNPDLRWLAERSDSGVGYGRQDPDIMRAVADNPQLLAP